MSTPYLHTVLRTKEDLAKELLLILANLLQNNLITEDRFVELGMNVLWATAAEALEATNQSERNKILPQAEAAITVAILSRVEADLRNEASDILDAEDAGALEEIKTRLGLTVWFDVWAVYGATIKRIAELGDKRIAWIVVPDERTCEICLQNEAGGPYEPSKLPVYPAHANCRCILEIL